MAVDQALERPRVQDVLRGLVDTALWQETACRDDWAETLGLLHPVLSAEPDVSLIDLISAAMLIALSNFSTDGPYLLPTTQTAWRLGDVVTEFVDLDSEGDERAVLFDLGQTGDLAGIAGLIRAADPAKSEAMAKAAAAGLIKVDRIEDAFNLLGLVPSAALSGKISRLASQHVLTTAGPAAAEALALRFANKGDRIDALFVVAHRWATTGHPDKALAVARNLPPEDLPEALAALGLAQIGTGDLPDALATEARISALSRQHPALKSLRRRLAPLLAAKGQAVKAVAMAEKLGDPWATAHVAAAMEWPATEPNPQEGAKLTYKNLLSFGF